MLLAHLMSFVFARHGPALMSPPEVRVHPGAQTNLNLRQLDSPSLGGRLLSDLPYLGVASPGGHL